MSILERINYDRAPSQSNIRTTSWACFCFCEVPNPGAVSANMLTPGVPLMARLCKWLEAYCVSRLGLADAAATSSSSSSSSAPPPLEDSSSQRWAAGLCASVSGAGCPGEGEHKILAALLLNEGQREGDEEGKESPPQPGESALGQAGRGARLSRPRHAVLGADADLFLLPLGPRLQPRQVVVANPTAKGLRVCDVDVLSRGIQNQGLLLGAGGTAADRPLESPEPRACLAPVELELGLRRDFVLVQLLRGNDYLPPLACSFSCEDLWPCYLRWRRTRSPDLGLVAQASGCRDDGSVQERLQILPAQMSDFMSRLSTGFPSGPTAQPIAAEELAKGVEAYVHGLIWCLETYVNGFCPDFHFRFPRAWTPCASAELLLRHNKALADGLAPASDGSCTAPAASPAACLASGSGGGLGGRGGVAPPPPLPPLSPLACAAAVLPVSELRALLLPTAPCLAALLEPEKGLLWEAGL
ncbi:unnamed protein product [Polarella glacialis]|uniref:Xrn1 N-terminal domain-containing protein n=1 Tax=Polarella glacialis TaxID=89957 RepID=A0A813EPD6_POLGL|nr:unnamed protein product [Polarella glacialis]